MAKQKFDGLIEAIRLSPSGQVEWVRAYERRGPTFSDIVLISRQDLVERLKAGKKFVVGERQEFLASTFDVERALTLVSQGGRDVLFYSKTNSPATPDGDQMEGVPVV